MSDSILVNQAIPPSANLLPIKKVCLFASGVGYFQHEGELTGSPHLSLPFPTEALNDILKSLVIDDPGTTSPSVSYSTEENPDRTLSGLSVNLSGNPDIAGILNSLRGAEVSIQTAQTITGRIIGAHTNLPVSQSRRPANQIYPGQEAETYLSLFVDNQIQMIALGEIMAYRFTDEKISADFHRALDLILSVRNERIKNITVILPGKKKRTVRLGYVMASPVWKASYRLDLQDSAGHKPFLQGWAIVDNVGDTDWQNVELSLVASRPISFRQDLYPPFHLERPLLPLSIAGYAEAQTYDSGFAEAQNYASDLDLNDGVCCSDEEEEPMRKIPRATRLDTRAKMIDGATYQMTEGKPAGDQFVFTVKSPVTLERRQSAMIPLTQTAFAGKKISIFSGQNVREQMSTNPMLGVELVNTSGMKLPAGPISVFDGDTYAGDALLEFLPENEKRMISYGEDLSVTGIASTADESHVETVKISQGVLNITRKQIYGKTYTFRNVSTQDKTLLLEHPFHSGTALLEPAKYSEKTGNVYRFSIPLPAGEEIKFVVRESCLLSEERAILGPRQRILSVSSIGDEIPKPIQKALAKAVAIHEDIEKAKKLLVETETRREEAIEEQVRIRENIGAAGANSAQGKEYLNKLSALDKQIEAESREAQIQQEAVRQAEKTCRDYIAALSF